MSSPAPFNSDVDVEKGNKKGLTIETPYPRSPRTPRTGAPHSAYSGAISGRSRRTQVSTVSVATQMLDTVLVQLDNGYNNVFGEEDETPVKHDDSSTSSWMHKWHHFRHHLAHWLHIPPFHYTIIGLVIFDLIVVFVDLVLTILNLSCFTDEEKEKFIELGLQVADIPEPSSCLLHESKALIDADWFLWGLSVFILGVFVLELFASFVAFGWRRFLKPLYGIDALVVLASFIMEIYFKFASGADGPSPAALVVLRLWKIVRAIHAIAHSIELKNQSIIEEVKEAKRQVEEENLEKTHALRAQEIQVEILLQKVSDLSEEELKELVQKELKKERAIEEKEREAAEGDSISDESMNEKKH